MFYFLSKLFKLQLICFTFEKEIFPEEPKLCVALGELYESSKKVGFIQQTFQALYSLSTVSKQNKV